MTGRPWCTRRSWSRRLFDEELEKLIANPGRDLGTVETFREARRISEAMVLNGEFDPYLKRRARSPPESRRDAGATKNRRCKVTLWQRMARLRTGAELELGSALGRSDAPLQRGGCGAPARFDADRIHAGAAWGGAAVEPAAERVLCCRSGCDDRQPGDPAGEGRTEGDLRQRMAGRGRCERCRANVSRPESLSGGQRAESGAANQSGA